MPRPSLAHRFPFLDHPTPIPFAHRGGAGGDGPQAGMENTVEAFQQAVDLGYRYLETDVHVTADGVLLLLHDRDLGRVAGQPVRVDRMSWTQVQQARIGGVAGVPRLEDVLSAWPQLRLNLDVKVMGAVAPLVQAIRRTNAVDRVCVGSFSDRRLAKVRAALGPRLCTSLGPRGAVALRAAASGRLPAFLAPRGIPCAQVPPQIGRLQVVTPRFVEAAHRYGLQVHVWTVDDPAQMEQLLDLGVDGIMTDRPDVLRAVLQRRGQWVDAG